MLLSKLLNINGLKIPESIIDFEVQGLSLDSRNIRKGYIFFSIKGNKADGRQFLEQAVSNGAELIITESDYEKDYVGFENIIFVDKIRKVMAEISSSYYRNPSKKVKVIGITGTNGKTTISYIIKSILEGAGFKCGLLGTISYITGETKTETARLTTPDSIELNMLLAEMVDNKIDYCIMEVSSIALSKYRVHSIEFDTAIYTNLTSEHMDLHINMQNYFEAKKKLFDNLKNGNLAISNTDDIYGIKILDDCSGLKKLYSINNNSDLQAQDINIKLDGLKFGIKHKDIKYIVESTLTGRFNIYNLLAAILFGLEKHIPIKTILNAVKTFQAAKGRFNRTMLPNGACAIVDYSHTSDSLRNAIEAAVEVRNVGFSKGKIITIFGCGGDRDKTKRSVMGEIATDLSDEVIITSDNPRTEDPEEIVKDILVGIKGKSNYLIEINREKAILKGLNMSRKGDIILICGKGHETYQEINGVKSHFDDQEIITHNIDSVIT
ncbi:MAG: UDP-N-acetylmuramoyl-L-alanyl-D-glutamate--2,6-diaminopimelate ligase [Candidatus Kapaibacterium sp.]